MRIFISPTVNFVLVCYSEPLMDSERLCVVYVSETLSEVQTLNSHVLCIDAVEIRHERASFNQNCNRAQRIDALKSGRML